MNNEQFGSPPKIAHYSLLIGHLKVSIFNCSMCNGRSRIRDSQPRFMETRSVSLVAFNESLVIGDWGVGACEVSLQWPITSDQLPVTSFRLQSEPVADASKICT